MKNPFVPNERIQLPRAMKNFAKLSGLRLFSHIHPKVLNILIRVFQQSAGFGFDSGLKNETKQFANEVLKFNLENPIILDVGANI